MSLFRFRLSPFLPSSSLSVFFPSRSFLVLSFRLRFFSVLPSFPPSPRSVLVFLRFCFYFHFRDPTFLSLSGLISHDFPQSTFSSEFPPLLPLPSRLFSFFPRSRLYFFLSLFQFCLKKKKQQNKTKTQNKPNQKPEPPKEQSPAARSLPPPLADAAAPAGRPGLALCAGCGGRIQDPFLLRVSPDLEWHVACLKCAECGQPLDETCTCFLRDGKAYCKRDYGRLFGIKCAQCRAAFSSSDLVMRARDHVYHLECFRCAACGRQLLPGDQFCLRERDLLCRADHGPPPDGAAARGPRSPAPPPAHLAEPVPGRPPGPRPQSHKAAEKTTRVRTVLNEKQLHTLRTCYAANPRPDALMKEQLVEMTGLSPRVIRVWFQNKRCKDKKKSILMKQLQQQQHSDKTSLQGLTGTPLVAGSPVRHESAVQGSAVEVQTYQPPWKALSDFALQSDLEPPAAFQQLVSFSESGSLGTSSGSDVTSLSSQLPDTPNSMVPSPAET
eukprot:XP_015134510.1 insulin gene enhancer protein ISL-2 isoform X2 [Gallus gallus]